MPSVPVRDLVGGQGVNYDQTPNSLPPNAFSDIVNGRFTRGRLERVGGSQVFAESPTVPELTNARFAQGITIQGNEGLFVATASNAYFTVNGSSWVDVTPLSGWADTDTWNLRQYGDSLLLTSLDTVPFVLQAGSSQLVQFADWPANYKCQVLFAYKNILIALGVTINNTVQSGLVKWSGVVTPADLANVGWDPADITTVAGENVLPDRDGEIRDGGVLRDSSMIYTDSSVWRMDLSNTVAGASPVVFNFRKVFSDDGILRNRCFSEVNGVHYVVGVYDIYINDGFNKQSISDNRLTEFFYDRIGTQDLAFMEHYQRPQEVILAYGVQEDTAAREAIVFNYFYNTWTRWSYGGAGIFTHITQAPEFAATIPTWQDWQDQGVRWSDLNNVTWNALFPQNRERGLYGLSNDGRLFRLDVGGAASSATPAELFIERRDVDLDEVFGGSSPIKYISRFVPIMVGEGTVFIQFGGRNALSSPIIWQPERPYVIGQDYKFDLRLSYRYPSFRIRQAPADGTLALDGFDFIVHAAGYR